MFGVAEVDDEYLEIFLSPIRCCAKYLPKLGVGSVVGKSVAAFMEVYSADPFYHWIGLDSELMYAAHKAAGGMTSIYRQVGVGGERLLCRVLRDQFDLTEQQCGWSYQTKTRGKVRTLKLDARIDLQDVGEPQARLRVAKWINSASQELLLSKSAAKEIRGAVFEVRQGYKSADAKRQNADIANASIAFAERYIPVLLLFSNQVAEPVAERYVRSKWLLLRGTLDGGETRSTYEFSRNVLGFDMAGFFSRHSQTIRSEIESVVRHLLSPS